MIESWIKKTYLHILKVWTVYFAHTKKLVSPFTIPLIQIQFWKFLSSSSLTQIRFVTQMCTSFDLIRFRSNKIVFRSASGQMTLVCLKISWNHFRVNFCLSRIEKFIPTFQEYRYISKWFGVAGCFYHVMTFLFTSKSNWFDNFQSR